MIALEIAVVLCSALLVATLPAIAAEQNQTMQKVSASTITTASEDDYVLGVYGNANEDDTIDMRDLTYVKLIFFGKKPETELADAKYDGKINPLDFIQIKLIIVGKEKELTIVDSADRIVTVKKPIRAAVINTYYELTVYALGAHDCIVGGSRKYSNRVIQVLTEEGKIRDIPDLGSLWSGINQEKMLELKANCVIVWAYSKTELEKVEDIEKKTGIPVIAVDLKTIDDYYRMVKLFGWLFDKEEKAEEIVEKDKSIIDEVIARTSDIPSGEKVRVFLTYGPKGSELSVEGKKGINTPILQMINAIPVTQDIPLKYARISFEDLYKYDPDKIILFSMSKVKPSPEDIYNDPKWQVLRAVKERKVCDLRGYAPWGCWNPGGMALRVLAFGKCCYPEQQRGMDFNSTRESIFREYYGISYEDIE